MGDSVSSRKSKILSQIFHHVIHDIISGEIEKAERMEREEEREGERKRQTSQEIKRKNPMKGGPPPTPQSRWDLHPLSIWWKTGFHMVVLTYAPRSSFRPWPGPQLRRRISMDSLTLRSNVSFFLLLLVMLVMTVGL